MLALMATAVSFMSRRSPWLHVRVNPKDGPRIKLSFPLPVRIATMGIHFAQGFVPDSERGNLDMAAGFLNSAQDNFKDGTIDPLFIDVDDDDGDRVQVFIG